MSSGYEVEDDTHFRSLGFCLAVGSGKYNIFSIVKIMLQIGIITTVILYIIDYKNIIICKNNLFSPMFLELILDHVGQH